MKMAVGMLGILMIPGSVGSDAPDRHQFFAEDLALPHKGSPAMRTEELAAQEGEELIPSLC